MGEEFVTKIDEIVELLESEEDSLYTYDEDKKIFKIFDKKRNINLIAKLEENNFYFKDNISGKVYILVKKYLNKNTTIQQILIDDASDRYYCMFAEKNNDIELIRVVEKMQDNVMSCTNTDLLNKNGDEIIEYMNETFCNKPYRRVEIEDDGCVVYLEYKIGNSDEYDNEQELDEYDEEQESDEYAGQEYDEYDDEQEYDETIESEEYNQYEENEENYENIEDEIDSEENNKLKDEEILEQYFAPYKVRYNNEEIKGNEKQEIVLETETILDDCYYDSLTMSNVTKVLTEALRDKQREFERESL